MFRCLVNQFFICDARWNAQASIQQKVRSALIFHVKCEKKKLKKGLPIQIISTWQKALSLQKLARIS